jgi:ferredoxin-NADP reductase
MSPGAPPGPLPDAGSLGRDDSCFGPVSGYGTGMVTGVLPGRRPLSRRVLRQAIRVFDVTATPYGVDRYVELVLPRWSSTEVRAKVVEVQRTTPRSVTLTLHPNGNWTGFRAGQHTQLSVEIDGVRHTRCYSMTNNALSKKGLIELSVTAHPEGRVSQHLFGTARKGQTVALTQALGNFTLPVTEPDHLLLISGGSGITPVMSMLRTRCALGWKKPLTFLHYAPTEADMIYPAELAQLARAAANVRLLRVFTDRPGAGDLDGFLSRAHLEAATPQWADAAAFVCGPAPLMAAADALFTLAGRRENLFTEAFTLTEVAAEAGSVDGTVRFGKSGLHGPSNGTTLLRQAEAQGLTPLTGCRMGICHTCTRRLCSGVVRDAVTGELTDGPDVNIRICVSVPVGDVEIDL